MHKRAPLSTPPTSPDGSPQRKSSAVGAAGTESHCPRPRRTDTKILPAKFISDTGALIRALAEELGGTTCFHIEVCSNAYNIRSTTGEDIDMVHVRRQVFAKERVVVNERAVAARRSRRRGKSGNEMPYGEDPALGYGFGFSLVRDEKSAVYTDVASF
ncbi:hypothetical protein OOU_Y34scaffold00550g7 [Pyricularia oryzae Y34]|uniref:Uncharacterized protein n=2 Tax=Pyricularia oryzae TaxID=318829 RepID=A0AA97PKW6_PYRO3|nr:hypothetical protein OOU_Y34scaffold00550g7 [Pyricularia oryzae Y34]